MNMWITVLYGQIGGKKWQKLSELWVKAEAERPHL